MAMLNNQRVFPLTRNGNLLDSAQVLGWPVVGIWSDPKYDATGPELDTSVGEQTGMVEIHFL